MKSRMKLSILTAVLALGLILPALIYAKEEKVKLADCPEAVQKTIKDKANGGTIVEVEKETKKDGTVVYEAEIKKDGKEFDVVVAADGTLIKVEQEDDDDDKDRHRDDD
jgi:uncharacterized membrane protein YkoI